MKYYGSVHEECQKHHVQACHICERLDCCDNTNPVFKIKTVKDIVLDYLKTNGFEGLYLDDCGCRLDDLFACGEIFDDCKSGYAMTCNTCYKHNGCEFYHDPKAKCVGPKQ